jgi:hypothetical protein
MIEVDVKRSSGLSKYKKISQKTSFALLKQSCDLRLNSMRARCMTKKDIFGLFGEASKLKDILTFFWPKSSQEASY